MYPMNVTELPLISSRPYNFGQAINACEVRMVNDCRAKMQDPDRCVAVDGVMFWRIVHSSGRVEHRVIPVDVLTDAFIEPWPAQIAAYKADLDAFFAEARKNATPLTGENLAEARAAFGPGRKLVNVITGAVTWT
jgi:hypothetical protein